MSRRLSAGQLCGNGGLKWYWPSKNPTHVFSRKFTPAGLYVEYKVSVSPPRRKISLAGTGAARSKIGVAGGMSSLLRFEKSDQPPISTDSFDPRLAPIVTLSYVFAETVCAGETHWIRTLWKYGEMSFWLNPGGISCGLIWGTVAPPPPPPPPETDFRDGAVLYPGYVDVEKNVLKNGDNVGSFTWLRNTTKMVSAMTARIIFHNI